MMMVRLVASLRCRSTTERIFRTIVLLQRLEDGGGHKGNASYILQLVSSGCDPSTSAGGRQTSPHPHSVVPGPSGSKYHYSPDLGLDKVFQYVLDDITGKLSIVDELVVAQCSGPRRMAFHPSGDLLHEMASTVTLHAVGKVDGKLSNALDTLPLVPDKSWHYWSAVPVDGAGNCTKAAEIRVTPNGKYIFASNRSIVALPLSKAGDAFVGAARVAASVT